MTKKKRSREDRLKAAQDFHASNGNGHHVSTLTPEHQERLFKALKSYNGKQLKELALGIKLKKLTIVISSGKVPEDCRAGIDNLLQNIPD